MRHQAQEDFRGIFIGIPKNQKGYIVYVPGTRKIISSYDVVFDESFSSSLAYTSQPYSEAMTMYLSLIYAPCDTYSRGKTGYIRLVPDQGVRFFYTRSHLSILQKCALIFPINI